MLDNKVFLKISYGLFVVSSVKGGMFNGQIANTVFQISAEPATIAISINKKNLTHEYIKESGVFSVSILSQKVPLQFIGHFGFQSGREGNKFDGIDHKRGVTGAPVVLEHSVGYLEGEVINSLDVKTHTVFIGRVVDAVLLNSEEPMTYAYYHQVKRGASHPAAPISVKEEGKGEEKEEKQMKKFQCTVCGYVYDPEKGDPDNGVNPGTAFADIPADWVCPVCGVGKDQFEEVE